MKKYATMRQSLQERSTMSRLLLLIVLFIYAAPLHALITITPVELGEKPGHSGKVGVSLSTKRGNSDTDAYKLASRLMYDNNISYVTWLQIAGEYGKASGVKNVQKLYAHLRYIHNLTDRYNVYELAAQTEEDEFRLIQSRRLVAAGYRHRFFQRNKKLKAFVGLGAIYEIIRYTQDNPNEKNARASMYASLSYRFKKDMSTSVISYYQPKFDDTADFVTVNTFELKLKIIDKLFLNFTLHYNYDSQPALGVESKYDFSQDTAFIYEF